MICVECREERDMVFRPVTRTILVLSWPVLSRADSPDVKSWTYGLGDTRAGCSPMRACWCTVDTLNKIYPQWRLSAQDVKRASKQRDLTGPLIQGFVSQQEIPILSMDSVPIVNAIKQGQLTSVQVTTAFCKAACCRCTSDRGSTGRPSLF